VVRKTRSPQTPQTHPGSGPKNPVPSVATDDIFDLLKGIAAGVLAIHNAGALHRDVKPANIIVQPDGSPVLMDLGVVTEALLPEHTRTDSFLGTIRYAHPEYLTGKACSQEIDAYSVGAIAYELLFGRRFLGEEENWASLTARVVAWGFPDSDDVASRCAALSQLHNHHVAEAAYWVVRNLIIRAPTPDSLRMLLRAIEARFWMSSFYETGEGIQTGVPAEIAWEHVSRRSPYIVWSRSLTSIWEELMLDTDAANRTQLATLLHSRYWRWRCILDNGATDEEIVEIDTDLGFFFDLFDTDKDEDLRPLIEPLLALLPLWLF
jgi:serine/threonine protein kinase